MPFPLTVTDDFNRANGAPGGLWTPDTDGADQPEYTIASNQLQATTNSWMYYDLALGATCEASVKMGAYTEGFAELELLVGAGTGAWGGYAVFSSQAGNSCQIFRYAPAPGSDSSLDEIDGTLSTGDEMGLRVLPGGVIEFHTKPAAGSWSLLSTVTDPDPLTGDFKAGLFSSHASTAYEDFSAASVAGASSGGLLNLYRRRRKE